ncbi:hypothetical protein BC835DRAFT_1306877 [Cytidiella melzeri]|nr:hypothetical protein BC835DRAFT_1306877 [Cytidiella melzeri]
MNPSSAPTPRPRQLEKRDSFLRASILDTAMELGVGTSKTVTHWMFNPIGEEDEEAESILSPSLTYASTATSDESWPSHSSSLNRIASDASNSTGISYLEPSSLGDVLSPQQHSVQFQSDAPVTRDAPSEVQVVTAKHRKLRKAKPDGNGYESDGGYVSDVVTVTTEKKKKKGTKSKADGVATGEESEGGYLSEVLARRRRKKKEKKEREAALGGTDEESDGGYLSSHSKKEKKSKKPPTPQGDESDGGYLSESSKRKRFMFRMNNKSRKRQDSSDVSLEDIIPPVPSLPPMSLPVAERFATTMLSDRSPSRADTITTHSNRVETPSTYYSRTETPGYSLGERASCQRSSDDGPSMADIPSRGPTPVSTTKPLPSPNLSMVGLTSAFNDAQSVRTPSTDVLRAFGRHALASAPRSPLKSANSTPDVPAVVQEDSGLPSSYTVPKMGMPPPKRNISQKRVPPQISAPNTQSLSVRAQHTFASGSDTLIPVTLTPPTPTPGARWRLGSRAQRTDTIPSPALSTNTLPTTPASSNFDSTPNSPSASTPSDSAYTSPAPSSGASVSSISPAQFRPNGLSKYDIPPLSPPPVGPLPQPPTEAGSSGSYGRLGNERSRRPSTADSDTSGSLRQTTSRMLRPVSPQIRSPPTGPLPPPPTSSSRSASGSLSQRLTPILTIATTTSVSPASPLGSEGGPPLFSQRIPSSQRGKEPPFPAHPLVARSTPQLDTSSRSLRAAENMPQPLSAGATNDDAQFQREQHAKLNVAWQPRSASALEHRQDRLTEKRQSWIDFEDCRDSVSIRTSTSSRPDIDSVLSILQSNPEDNRSEVYNTRSAEGPDEDDRSRYPDDEEDFDNRYSVFSDSAEPSRISILDKERSSNARQKFLKRVEQMYSKEGIARGSVPPVPSLPPPSSPRWK